MLGTEITPLPAGAENRGGKGVLVTDERETVRHVFLCGAKSIGQYGGYETFADKLSEYQRDNPQIKLHILCKAQGEGHMDETKLPGVKRLSGTEFEYHNAHCVKLPVPRIGGAAAVYYDCASVRYCIRYCRARHISHPIVYLLACRIGPFAGWLKKKIHALGGQLHVNPDGHEWIRGKWSLPVRKYWKLSEKGMIRQADLVVCDSRAIERYIQTEYRAFHPRTAYIAYGAETVPSHLTDGASEYVNWMREKGLKKNGYCLAVGRFVPENNIETMIREFMRSASRRDFVLITNRNDALLRRLERKLRFSSDSRIKFVGPVYQPDLLKKIRENAFAYLHGHEVGGTNPSLVESLAATPVSLALDVPFNRETARDAALYWDKTPGNLAALIDRIETLSEAERSALGEKAKDRVRTAYAWPLIAERYGEIWTQK